MTLQQLKYAVAVAECRTISAAAEKVFISQPSLTSSIKQLEDEMNVQIFSRTNKGVDVTKEGELFLSYARQVLAQANLLEEKFTGKQKSAPVFSVSTQHYSFAVDAMVDVIKQFGGDKYNFTLRETQTYEIIDDVSRLRSELGILYVNRKNEDVLMKLLKKNELEFQQLFVAQPHVFISDKNPLSKKKTVLLTDLQPYPYLVFEQGEHSAVYFDEEPYDALNHDKIIMVRDRATLFNLVIGLNGFTVSSGVISKELNGSHIVARPLEYSQNMRIGIVTKKNIQLTEYARTYIECLKRHV